MINICEETVPNLKKRNLSASLLSFSDNDPKTDISLVKQTRSDLLLVQEITKKQINVRAWNPTKNMIQQQISEFDQTFHALPFSPYKQRV